jgi:hypothetical protein
MRYFLYLTLFLLFLSSSCRKEPAAGSPINLSDSTTAEGTVVDATDGKPIPYAQTFLTKDNGGTWSAWGIKTVDTKIADVAGKFFYSFKAERNYSYTVYGQVHNYEEDNTGAWIKNLRQKNTGLLVKLKPFGWIKAIIQNASPKDTIKALTINGVSLYNFYQDTSFILTENGNFKNQIVIGRNYGQ